MKAHLTERRKVQIGSRIKLVNSRGELLTVKLVGPGVGDLDSDPIEISTASPLGKALVSRCEGDQIEVETPVGTIT